MLNKKHLIHCLLAVCIGLLPMLSAGAMSVEHMDSVAMDCPDCAPVERHLDSGCEDHECSYVGQHCGYHTCASYLHVSPLVENIPVTQVNDLPRYDSSYRQAITDQIYRPPIA